MTSCPISLNGWSDRVLDDDVLFGNTEPAFNIYNLYKKRVEDRVAKVKELLK